MRDEQMWSMGNYVFLAVYSAIGKSFEGEKCHVEYPDRPFSWPKKTDEEIEQEQADRELQKMLAQENAWVVQGKLMGLPNNT